MGHKEDLTIKPVEIDEEKFNKVEHDPFIFPSCTIVLGAVASGKTTWLHNYIRITKPVFDGNVILFSPTLKNDPILDKMIEEDDILDYFEHYTNGTLNRVLETIKEMSDDDDDNKQKYVIIFDDILGSLPRVGSREAQWFNKFISTYRHGGGVAPEGSISLVFCVQKFTSLLPVLRENASYYVLLGQFGDKNLKHLAEELHPACGYKDSDFMECWEKAHQKPYDFLMLDFRKMKAYRNLTDLLYSKEEHDNKKFNNSDSEEEDTDSDSE
jgi:hypothetical protein